MASTLHIGLLAHAAHAAHWTLDIGHWTWYMAIDIDIRHIAYGPYVSKILF